VVVKSGTAATRTALQGGWQRDGRVALRQERLGRCGACVVARTRSLSTRQCFRLQTGRYFTFRKTADRYLLIDDFTDSTTF
jgi:hypothetical protein